MRFRKGHKVEVLSKAEVPFGAWHSAEIVSGNGHYYNVKFDNASCVTSGEVAEMVSWDDLRPRPPPMKADKNWAVGDVVEVFTVCSWKIAIILKILSGNYYQVRLTGFGEECKVHASNIRVRQSWQDNKWVVVAKANGIGENMEFGKVSMKNRKRGAPSLPSGSKMKVHVRDDHLDIQSNTGLPVSRFVSSVTQKGASPYHSSYLEADNGKRQKLRKFEEQGEQQGFPAYRPPLLNKVDVVAYPQEEMCQTYMHSSFSNQTPGYYEVERGRPNVHIECFLAKSSEPNESNSDASSVGSCSVVSHSAGKLRRHILAVPNQEADVDSSDAESCLGRGDAEEKCASVPSEEALRENIHSIELHAYKSTLGALYASGPLSWEQEELLTNLRLSLHISNDEHLSELRNLISGGLNALGQHWGHATLANMMPGLATFVLA